MCGPHRPRSCCHRHRAEHASALSRALRRALLPLRPFAAAFPLLPFLPCPVVCALSLTVPIHTPACSHAGHHMCVRPRAERVCAGVRGVYRVRDAVPRRRHKRVRQHGRGPLQRERHRHRQHHVQQRACRRRPRTARRVPAPPCHGRPDRRHLPRLPPFPCLRLVRVDVSRCCSSSLKQTEPYRSTELRSCVPTTVAYVVEYRVAGQSFALARNASLAVAYSGGTYTATDPRRHAHARHQLARPPRVRPHRHLVQPLFVSHPLPFSPLSLTLWHTDSRPDAERRAAEHVLRPAAPAADGQGAPRRGRPRTAPRDRRVGRAQRRGL